MGNNICDIALVANIHEQGVEQFRSALEMAPRNHSAYFGLASALLAWSKIGRAHV